MKTMNWCRVFLLCLTAFNGVKTGKFKKVAVIGAGVSGLTSSRYLKQIGANFTVFELTPYAGGTWRFEPRVGFDEYGDPIFTSMYKNLRTNVPKILMQFPGFPLPEETSMFPRDEDIYEYLINFIKHFQLDDFIKYNHKVTKVEKLNDKWKVTYVDRYKKEEFTDLFDYVIVGSGHLNKPNYPEVPGEEQFKGKIIHTHDYRYPEPYQDKRVLVVGDGPSANDITMDILPRVAVLYSSDRKESFKNSDFSKNLVKKPGLKEFNETGIFFVDGTYAEIDDVIYGTGYIHYHPFLDKSCEFNSTKEYIAPLHLQTVNINQPTIFVLGTHEIFLAIDAQARYVAAFISGNFTLPTKERMMEEWQAEVDLILQQKRPLKKLHSLFLKEDAFFANLTAESGIAREPPCDIYKMTFRNYNHTILDDYNFKAKLIHSKNKYYFK